MYDYSRLASKIHVSVNSDGVTTYDGFTSMFLCLSQCGDTFTKMPFSHQMWLVAETLNHIDQAPDPVISTGRMFIYTFRPAVTADDYRVTVIDSLDNSILIDEYYKNLQLANIMDSITDINGLYTFLVSSGEMLPSDELVMTNDPKLSNQLTGFDNDELQA